MLVVGGGAALAIIGLRRAARLGLGTPAPTRNYIPQIDGLRGCLAFCVMAYHFALWYLQIAFGVGWDVPEDPLLASLGPGAVNLFFMVTGLVFYDHVLKGASGIRWTAFAIGRVCRILPMVAASTALVALMSLILVGCTPRAPLVDTAISALVWLTCWDQPALFGYERSAALNAGVLWSLRFEWAFYLAVLPAAALLRDLVRRVGAPTVTVPLVLLIVALAGRPWRSSVPLFLYLHLFAIGMLAAELMQRPNLARVAATHAGSALALACLAVGAFFPGPGRMVLHSVAFILIACGADIFGLLRSTGARLLGDASFSLYLLHGIVLACAFETGLLVGLESNWLLLAFPCLALTAVAASTVTYRLVERPAIEFGKRLTPRMRTDNRRAAIYVQR